MSSFNVKNVSLDESVSLSSQNTQNQIDKLNYQPNWVFQNTATNAGTFTIDMVTGYKIVNVIDANGWNVKSWINSLQTLLVLSGLSPPIGGFSIYTNSVDGTTGASFLVSNVANINDNGNNTFTLGGGDVYGGSSFSIGERIYFSTFMR
jgi:hypothetical protein